jgi:integrase/recombinase XerD
VLARERDAYLAHLAVERGLSSNTLLAYRRDIDRYLDFIAARGANALGEVVPADVAAFAEALGNGADGRTQLAPASAARVIVAVRGWHRFALAEGWAATDAAAGVKPRSTPQRLPKAIPIHEVEALLDASATSDGSQHGDVIALRDRALLELLYATGARVSEAVGLDVDDLGRMDAGRSEPPTGGESQSEPITSAKLRGKGSKERMVPMGAMAASALDAYLVRGRPALSSKGRGTPRLFLNLRGAPLSRQSAWAILQGAAERAGVSHVSPHTLRHSFATHLLAGGADVRVVQELLGHASVTTTQVYTRVTPDALREVYLTFHPRAYHQAGAAGE